MGSIAGRQYPAFAIPLRHLACGTPRRSIDDFDRPVDAEPPFCVGNDFLIARHAIRIVLVRADLAEEEPAVGAIVFNMSPRNRLDACGTSSMPAAARATGKSLESTRK